MYPVLLSIHVLICMLVILIVLLQSGKGAGFSGLFGGGSSDALFNAPSGSMFLRKVTTGLVAGFFMTSLFLTYLAARQRVTTVTRPMEMPMNVPLPDGHAAADAAPKAPADAPPAKTAPVEKK